SWGGIASLYLALQEQDRSALLRNADVVRNHLPDNFPTTLAEKQQLDLLIELGLTRTQAGLEVLAARSAAGLLVLRELDQGLTREATFYQQAGREPDARRLRGCRDALRRAYLQNARHLAERDFALDLAEQFRQRDALREKARRIDYLQDRKKLLSLVQRIGEKQTWDLVLAGLLDSELKIFAAPPALHKL